MVLANPGHPATDLPRAQRVLRELMANPEMLLSGERALAFLELQQIDDHLTLEAENRRLQGDAVRADRERLSTVNRRLQLETDENARLRNHQTLLVVVASMIVQALVALVLLQAIAAGTARLG